jgi:hypothetical protein
MGCAARKAAGELGLLLAPGLSGLQRGLGRMGKRNKGNKEKKV